MKRKIIGTMTAISLCAVLTCAAVFAVYHENNTPNEPYIITDKDALKNEAAALNSQPAGNHNDSYIIKAYRGEICIFYGNDINTPAVFTGIMMSGLRNSDKAMLNDGIILNSYEKVVAILEDFGS